MRKQNREGCLRADFQSTRECVPSPEYNVQPMAPMCAESSERGSFAIVHFRHERNAFELIAHNVSITWFKNVNSLTKPSIYCFISNSEK